MLISVCPYLVILNSLTGLLDVGHFNLDFLVGLSDRPKRAFEAHVDGEHVKIRIGRGIVKEGKNVTVF